MNISPDASDFFDRMTLSRDLGEITAVDIKRRLVFIWCGVKTYREGLDLQAYCQKVLLEEGKFAGLILGLEHESVVSFGRRGNFLNDSYVTRDELDKNGFAIEQSERGGHATLHSPGQLVVYPCLNLRPLGLGPREYVAELETSVQKLLSHFDLSTVKKGSEPGLYTESGKIAFFGLKISRGLTSHGASINVANDLSAFSLIKSCGVLAEKFDRLRDHGILKTPSDVFSILPKYFL
jgi:lipoyl(octanoyl) transferase